MANPIIQRGGNTIRLTYQARTVVAASLDADGVLIVTYSDGIVEDTGLQIPDVGHSLDFSISRNSMYIAALGA